MISTLLFTAVSIVTLATIFQAYVLSAQVRYRDQARFVLNSAVDQFLTAPPTDAAHPNLAINGPRTFFADTTVSGPTGTGMGYYRDLKLFVFEPQVSDPMYPYCEVGHDTTGLKFQLVIDPAVPSVEATMFRAVQAVDPATGNVVAGAPTVTPAGYMLRGDFSISFPFRGKTYTQRATVVRTLP